MTIEEVEDLYKGQYADIEVYTNFNSTKYGFHTDRIKTVDDYKGDDEVREYSLVDEEEYDQTILANTSIQADFEDWFGDKKAKILLVKVA